MINNENKSKKKIMIAYFVIFIGVLIGITYALQMTSLTVALDSAIVKVDEDVYGDTNLDTSNLDLIPILDSDVDTNLNNVLKIDFTVGGSNENTRNDVIYDIALVDLQVNCDLLSEYVKWKLVKNGEELSSGSLSYTFDTIVDGRLVLTNIQQDLPVYNANQEGYDEYSFYLWISDPCQDDLATCYANKNMVDTSTLMGKFLSGAIEVELYTDSKKALVRRPSDTLDETICTNGALLNNVEVGSYVKYIGNNGCVGDACRGVNANSSENSNGYCNNSSYEYNGSGWRVAYIKNDITYLVSAGSPECMCTNSDGATSNSSCSNYISTNTNIYLHTNNLNNKSLNYCNIGYSVGNVCNDDTVWSMNPNTFSNITNKSLNESSCYASDSDTSCGYNNDLIDNGGYYWLSSPINSSEIAIFFWDPSYRRVNSAYSYGIAGIRPVIALDKSIIVVDGTGTVSDPYILKSPNTIEDLSGNMNNGVVVGSTWNKGSGLVSTDGVDDYVDMGLKRYEFGSDVSFVARVKINYLETLTTVNNNIVANFQQGGGGLVLQYYNNAYRFYSSFYTGSAYTYAFYSTDTLDLDTWYTIVGTYDGSNVSLYINGELVSSSPATGDIASSITPIVMGCNPYGTSGCEGEYGNNTYSDVLIFDRALSASEITTNYSGEIKVEDTTDLLVQYDFKS